MMTPEKMGGYVHHMEKVDGRKVRERSDSFKDYFTQAKLFFDSMSEVEKKHILDAFHFELGKVEIKEVRQRMVYMMANVDRQLANDIAKGIGVEPPTDEEKIKEVAKDALPRLTGKKSIDRSPALSQENLKGTSIKGRKIAVLLDEGFDEESLNKVKNMLMNEGAMTEIVSKFHGKILGNNGGAIETDKSHITTASVLYDGLFIPGGQKSVDAMMMQGDVIQFINEMYKHSKPIAASGEAVSLFQKANIVGARLTGNSEGTVSHMGVVTVSAMEKLVDFVEQFKTAILQHRHWDREKYKDQVPA